MARAIITNVSDYRLSDISLKNSFKSKISYSKPFTSRIDDVLPFRVKFINIGVPSYNPDFPPPIGIAIIGVNNYIL
jgi:hypothetical protein